MFIFNFHEKSPENGLIYVRGMLIDVDNINQAESHKWVRHIFKHTWHMLYILFFKRNRIYPLGGLGLVYVVDVD